MADISNVGTTYLLHSYLETIMEKDTQVMCHICCRLLGDVVCGSYVRWEECAENEGCKERAKFPAIQSWRDLGMAAIGLLMVSAVWLGFLLLLGVITTIWGG